jgi:hypothetical protein
LGKDKGDLKNKISIQQLRLACRHVDEMLSAGVSENFAIRLLEHFADVYARIFKGGTGIGAPLHVRHIELWSKAAIKLKKQRPNLKPRDHLRVEHGTPRREFARKVLALHKEKRLSEKMMNNIVRRYWKLAVITLEEDLRLNKIARSKAFSSPGKRWAEAGIKF